MKKSFISALLFIALLACTKENTTDNKPEPAVPTIEFEALKQEVAKLFENISVVAPSI